MLLKDRPWICSVMCTTGSFMYAVPVRYDTTYWWYWAMVVTKNMPHWHGQGCIGCSHRSGIKASVRMLSWYNVPQKGSHTGSRIKHNLHIMRNNSKGCIPGTIPPGGMGNGCCILEGYDATNASCGSTVITAFGCADASIFGFWGREISGGGNDDTVGMGFILGPIAGPIVEMLWRMKKQGVISGVLMGVRTSHVAS